MKSTALGLVFSNKLYIVLSVVIFGALFVMLSITSEYFFIKPILIFHVPSEDIAGFILVVTVSALSGLIVSMSVFRVKTMHAKQLNVSLAGPIIGASAGVCSCGPVGFTIISTFGTIGSTATAFLANYEIPLRLFSIGILIFTYYYTSKGITAQCKIQ